MHVPNLAAWSALLLALTLVAPASADFPGRHPYYLHAMGDLRYAHALLDHGDYAPGVDGQEDLALRDIAHAYSAIEAAGLDDGKNIDAHDVDAGLDHPGRLHRTIEALQRAQADIAQEEDDPTAVGLRDRALRYVNQALGHVQHALKVRQHEQH